jgi:hypothetical protein
MAHYRNQIKAKPTGVCIVSEVRVRWDHQSESGEVCVPLSEQSPWCSFLGDWELPIDGSIDQLDESFGDLIPERVSLCGCPSALLLPVIWIRTIWGRNTDTHLRLQWDSLDTGLSNHTQRQAAARLACLLVDEVSCSFQLDVLEKLGFDPLDRGSGEEMCDLMTYLIDSWDPNLKLAILGEDWTSAMQRVLMQCTLDGHKRIGIYGAGTHTKSVGEALMAPESTICCIIDDDERRFGDQLWGYPIVSPEQALEFGLDAVILSANSIEEHLWEKAAPLRDAGVETIKIYGGVADE